MQLEGLVIPISLDAGLLLKGVSMVTGLIEGAVEQTFEWANGMDHLGDVTGMTADQTAAWSFVAQKAGVDVDSLANSTVILTKGLFDSEGQLSSTGKALEDFGISLTDADGNVRDSSALMKDVAAKYAEFGTQAERVEFLTNLFGRSGADLIDVFDVLAQEGGIDAVEQKVKDLGLAIDPDTYEQFTRNLEELKLAGQGLAVQFVNGLMPAAERVLEWAKQFQGMSPEEILSRLGELAEELPAKFQAWTESVDWAKVSDNLVKGINSVDWAALGQKVGKAAQQIATGLANIFKGVKWKEIFGAIGTAFMEFATGLGGGSFQQFKTVWQNNWNQAKEIVSRAMELAKQSVMDFLRSIPAAISSYFAQAYANLTEWIGKMLGALAGLTTGIAGASTLPSTGGSAGTGGTLSAFATGGQAGGLSWVGEHGPELVNLPQGSYVNNSQTSNRMANQPVQAYIDYDELARTLARVLGQQMQRA